MNHSRSFISCERSTGGGGFKVLDESWILFQNVFSEADKNLGGLVI